MDIILTGRIIAALLNGGASVGAYNGYLTFFSILVRSRMRGLVSPQRRRRFIFGDFAVVVNMVNRLNGLFTNFGEVEIGYRLLYADFNVVPRYYIYRVSF